MRHEYLVSELKIIKDSTLDLYVDKFYGFLVVTLLDEALDVLFEARRSRCIKFLDHIFLKA